MPDPLKKRINDAAAGIAPSTDELKSLLLSEQESDRQRAIDHLVELLSSRDDQTRAIGYALYRDALEEALYRSCLNYRSLVGGFTHPLLSVMERAIEKWATASERDSSARKMHMEIAVPAPLKAEHDELHAELAAATKLSGPVGAAAREVAKLLHPHFVKEEQFALPPLGLLSALASGHTTSGMEAVVALTDRLKGELPTMLAEHLAILDALEKLTNAARTAGDEVRVHFAHKLAAHARIEEAVMYPAAILVGEWVKTHGKE